LGGRNSVEHYKINLYKRTLNIVNMIGVDYVGLGSDFDGIESAPTELEDITRMPLITKALLDRGYSKKDILKILGGNFIRLFEANMKQ
jgi:membrane dipeptidase